VGVHILLGAGVVMLLLRRGWVWLIPPYVLLTFLSLMWLKPWDKRRFIWYLEETNPDLKERLISLYELLRRGVNHPSVKRLSDDVSSLAIRYRPHARALLPFVGLSVLIALAAMVPLPGRPPVRFVPPKAEMLEGDSLPITFRRVGDTLTVLLGERDSSGGSYVLRIEGKVKRSVKVRGGGWISDLPAGKYTLKVEGFSGRGHLNVLARPVLYGVKGYIVPPSYMGLSKRPLQRENVAYEGSTLSDLKIEHNGDSARFVNLPDTLREDTEVFVEVFRKGKGHRYLAFKVRVIGDNPPSVALQPTGLIKAEEDVPAVVAAYDDIALKDVGILILRDGRWSRERLGPQRKVPNASYDLLFSSGDTLKVVAYATDVAGQTSLSDTLIIMPKGAEEILREKLLSQKTDEVEDLERRLKDLQEELEVSQNLSESVRRDVSQVMDETERAYREIQETLERISAQVKDPELARLITEVQRLFKETAERELMEALKKLQEALKHADPREVAEALKNLRLNQRQLKEELERFKKLLERYAQEKRLKDLTERLQSMAHRQAQIEGKNSPYEQGKLLNDLERAQRTLDSLRNVEDIDRKALAALDSLLRSAKRSMESAMEKMKRGGNFKPDQSDARKSLQRAADISQKTYDNLTERRMREVVSKLKEIGDAAAFLDQRLDREPDSATVEAAKRSLLQMEAELKELSQKNVFVSPRMTKLARKAYEDLEAAQRRMSSGEREGALQHIKNAQSLLRMLSLMASSSAQACQNAGGSTGMEAYMRQLARMAGEQRSISQQMGEGMSSQELAEMLARQMALRKALEGMLQGMKERGLPSDALQNLEEAVREMRELERQMQSPDAIKRANDLKRRVHRITIRLLEARKALRKQRTEPKYEAQRPKPFKVVKEYAKPVIDRRKISEIYRKYLREGKLSPEERKAYERYMRAVLE